MRSPRMLIFVVRLVNDILHCLPCEGGYAKAVSDSSPYAGVSCPTSETSPLQ